jgi:LuxR family transcriptional regulator, maltose regulon positive regulatory protein
MIKMTEPTEVRATVPVLETKLHRPSISSLHVARPRLLEQFGISLDRRLILVSAPAGYGKTALVSQWLGSVDRAYAWLSVDEQDDDLAGFLLYLVSAIRTVYPDAMAAIDLLLRAPTLLAPPRLADALLQGLASLPGPLVLAFDDYHAIQAPEVHVLMARLLEHLPAPVCVVLITRADPPLPLDRLRGRRQLAEIRAADLRFSPEETRLLLQQALGPEVSDETAALLEQGTEGWAVGLQLAALSLRDRGDREAFARKIAQYGHQSVTDYLLSEVLTGLPPVQRDCLLQTALFDRFCSALIDAGQAPDGLALSGDDFLRVVQRANLFVVALDDEGTWFRYHHLFQSLLRARLGLHYKDAEIKAMHARASAWFAEQGLIDEAVVHAVQAGDPLRAAILVEEQVHPALDREDWRQIERWIGLLPAEVASRPRLLLAQAWLHFIRWQFGGIEARLAAAESAMSDGPAGARGIETVVRGEISVLRAALAYNRGDGRLTVQHGEAALAALHSEMRYTMGMALVYHIWGLQLCGEYERAVALAHSQLDVHGWQPHALTLRLILALASLHHEMANLPAIEDLLTIWQKLAGQSGLRLSMSWSQFGQGWLHYQRNELAAAEESFRRLANMAWTAHGRAVVDGYTGLVLTALARSCPHEASMHINALNEHLMERGMLALAGVAQSLEQRVALASGSDAALNWRLGTKSVLVSEDLWEQPELTQVRTWLAGGAADALAEAAGLLADSRAKALARNSMRRLIEVGALQALVLTAQGNEPAALAVLQEAVELAAPGGALRLLVDAGSGLIDLLQKLQAASVAPRYIQNVLAAFAEPPWPPVPAARPTAAALLEKPEVKADVLTNREIDVLTLLAERLTDKEIAERLVLSPVTVKKHTQRIYRKLGVDNRRAAAAQARHLGLI